MSFLSSRVAAGLSQDEVAKKIGVDQSSVSLWDCGKTMPRAALLPSIAKLYGVTVDELLKKDENES